MGEWKEYVLEDVIEKFIDYRGKTPKKVNSGIPLITAKVIKDGSILTPNEFIEKDQYDLWMTRGLPLVNDVLITTEAPLGEVALVKDSNIALAQRIILLRGKEVFLDNLFLFYSFRSHLMQCRLLARASGSTVQGIKSSELKKILIPLPPLEEQKAIASVLSCLDAKIENLRKQNNTLEQIAQTLFKHWFIDFEFPNTDGKPYKSSGGKMQSSVLGDIPVEWRAGKLGDILTLNYGKSLISNNRMEGLYPVVGSNGIVDYHNDFIVKAPSIVIGRKGTIGKVIWLDKDFYPIDTTFFVTDNLNCNGLYFHYFLLQKQNFIRLMSDSAIPGLNRDMAYSVECSLPVISLINKFNDIVKSFVDKKTINYNQIETLKNTRDTLLPKLTSGELRVKE